MSHYHEQFLKQNPLAVLGVLRDLHKAAIPLRLSWNGGQLISKLLAITPDKLVLDFGSQAEDSIAVLKAQHITITAETQGAKVEFTRYSTGIWQPSAASVHWRDSSDFPVFCP